MFSTKFKLATPDNSQQDQNNLFLEDLVCLRGDLGKSNDGFLPPGLSGIVANTFLRQQALENGAVDDNDDEEDPQNKLKDGEVAVVWASGSQSVHKSQELALLDRAFLPGDLVQRRMSGHHSFQLGRILHVDMMCDITYGDTRRESNSLSTQEDVVGGAMHTIRRVHSSRLVHPLPVKAGDYVITQLKDGIYWLVRVETLNFDIVVRFPNQDIVQIKDAQPDFLLQAGNYDENSPFYFGQQLFFDDHDGAKFLSGKLRDGGELVWLQGKYTRSVAHHIGRVIGISISFVDGQFVSSLNDKAEIAAFGENAPQIQQLLQRLVTNPAQDTQQQLQQLVGRLQNAVGDQQILDEDEPIDINKIYTFHNNEFSLFDCVIADVDGLLAMDEEERASSLSIESCEPDAPLVCNMHSSIHGHLANWHRNWTNITGSTTLATVHWQDGSVERLSATALVPAPNPSDIDFLPQDFVVRRHRAHEEGSASLSNATEEQLPIGVVQRVIAAEQLAVVKWVPGDSESPIEPRTEEISVYELALHPFFSMSPGNIVVRLPAPALLCSPASSKSIQEAFAIAAQQAAEIPPSKPEKWIARVVSFEGEVNVRVQWLNGFVELLRFNQVISLENFMKHMMLDDIAAQGHDVDEDMQRETTHQLLDAFMNRAGQNAGHLQEDDDDSWEDVDDDLGDENESWEPVRDGEDRQAAAGNEDEWEDVDDENEGAVAQEHVRDADDDAPDDWDPEHFAEELEEQVAKMNLEGTKLIGYNRNFKPDGYIPDQTEQELASFVRPQQSAYTLPESQSESAIPQPTTAVSAFESTNMDSFQMVDDIPDHHFRDASFSGVPRKEFTRRLHRELSSLRNDLPQGIIVQASESRSDLLRATIVGPKDTPYYNAVLVFDIFLPQQYPVVPPRVYFHSFGYRLNPNLYDDGLVCLSLLGTWDAKKSDEGWNPDSSSILQVLVSILGLVLVEEPYYNEPGYEAYRGTPEGSRLSHNYNERVLLDVLAHIAASLSSWHGTTGFVRAHFRRQLPQILDFVSRYLDQQQHVVASSASVAGESGTNGTPVVDDYGQHRSFSPSRGFQSSLRPLISRLQRQISALNE